MKLINIPREFPSQNVYKSIVKAYFVKTMQHEYKQFETLKEARSYAKTKGDFIFKVERTQITIDEFEFVQRMKGF
jgi:bacterioferritin (cytochrome b1)